MEKQTRFLLNHASPPSPAPFCCALEQFFRSVLLPPPPSQLFPSLGCILRAHRSSLLLIMHHGGISRRSGMALRNVNQARIKRVSCKPPTEKADIPRSMNTFYRARKRYPTEFSLFHPILAMQCADLHSKLQKAVRLSISWTNEFMRRYQDLTTRFSYKLAASVFSRPRCKHCPRSFYRALDAFSVYVAVRHGPYRAAPEVPRTHQNTVIPLERTYERLRVHALNLQHDQERKKSAHERHCCSQDTH